MTEEDYIAAHISPEPEHLRALYRHTHMHRLYPRMCTDHVQGRLLAMLTAMIRPRRVLELGTFTGYSTLCFAGSLPDGGHIDTVEVDDDYREDLLDLFEDYPVTLHTGDASALLPGLLASSDYDLVFIDADKRRYCDYYRELRRHLRPGAYILADNTLWDDKVLNPDANDPQTRGIRDFNDLVAADSGVEKVILPVRDGLSLIRITGRP